MLGSSSCSPETSQRRPHTHASPCGSHQSGACQSPFPLLCLFHFPFLDHKHRNSHLPLESHLPALKAQIFWPGIHHHGLWEVGRQVQEVAWLGWMHQACASSHLLLWVVDHVDGVVDHVDGVVAFHLHAHHVLSWTPPSHLAHPFPLSVGWVVILSPPLAWVAWAHLAWNSPHHHSEGILPHSGCTPELGSIATRQAYGTTYAMEAWVSVTACCKTSVFKHQKWK